MRGDPFLPFQINVFVDNSETKGPPVITESNPNFLNLFGKIERRFLFGGYLSDHTMLKPGALQRANGGYLLLSATGCPPEPGGLADLETGDQRPGSPDRRALRSVRSFCAGRFAAAADADRCQDHPYRRSHSVPDAGRLR